MVPHTGKKTKKIRNGGFTLLETLLTVAILIILLGISAVGVVYYRDYLKITELDNAARDIYMAAENRAVLLQNSGASVALLSAGSGGSGGIVTLSSAADKARLAELLPAGTIDPALWNGDFRVVYDKGTGHVKEVFYAEKNIDGDLDDFRAKSRASRVTLFRSGKALVGYYGSEVGEPIGTRPLPTPGVEVFIENGEELTLTVRYTLPEGLPAGVTAKPSVSLTYGTQKVDDLIAKRTPVIDGAFATAVSGSQVTYKWVLDCLSGKQFKDLVSSDLGKNFTVTAGLTLKADGWIDSAYYAQGTDNSLFAKETGDGPIAHIANLRHLQNLCAGFSKAGGGITKAEQLNDIDCERYCKNDGTTVLDPAYKFIPITNENLSDYNGQNKHICSLSTKTDSSAAGLFGTVSNDLTVRNTRVCWTRPEALVDGGAIVCAVSGTNAGGLIGAVTGGTVKIENSFAATTVQGADKSGGLVGTQTGGTLTIKNSYADCYLSGKNAGGLVGSGSATLSNCYAAGFIMAGGTDTAGLVNGSASVSDGGVYSVVRVMDGNGKLSESELKTSLATDLTDNGTNVRYLERVGDAFTVAGFVQNPETHVYDLRHKLSGKDEDALTPPYPFPGLKDLPHYGDWAELDSVPAGLAYYEEYEGSTNPGVWGVLENGDNLHNLKKDTDNPIVKKDGYALVFEGAAPGKYVIQYGNGEYQAPWTLEGLTPISVDVDGKTYTLLPLPDDIVTGKLSEERSEVPEGATAKFYQQLTCGTGADMRIYWFNPHFAKTVKQQNDAPDPTASAISVRTPRHFYDLSRFQSSYKTYSFLQELDLDYAAYSWYGSNQPDKPVEGSGSTSYKQLPIGSSGAAYTFRGAYDGGCHTIKNVFFKITDSYGQLGLFGHASNNSSLKNIVYEMDPESAEEVSRNGTGGYCGALLGQLQGASMENCAVYGVNMHISGVGTQCGGLVGDNSIGGVIKGCSAEVVSLKITDGWAGGLAGSNSGAVENSYAVGKLVSNKDAGGLINDSGDGTVTNCYAAVWVNAEGAKRGLCHYPKDPAGKVTDSGFLTGTFRYRGEEYTVDNSYAGPGERMTPAQLAEKLPALAGAASTVKNLPAGAGYAADYAGDFPYLTGVTDAAGQAVHYGLWPVAAAEAPPVGLAYYEQYDSTNSSHGLEGVYGDVKLETLQNKSVYLDGYALVVPEEGYDPSAPITYTVTYGGKSWTWKRNSAKWDNPQSAEVQERFEVIQDGKSYQVFPLPAEVITGAPADTSSFYQELSIARGGVAESQTFYFNPHFAKTVRSERPQTDPQTEGDRVSVRTPRHLYDLSVYSDTYAPKGLYYGQEFDLNYQTYSWDYAMKPTQDGSVYLQAPIGTNVDHSFTGTYDGGTHTIQNVVYRTGGGSQVYFGLFGCAAASEPGTSTLKNIHYKTVGQTVQNAGISGRDTYVGMLAGQAATVANCTVEVSGSLTVQAEGSTLFAGGLAGCAEKIEGECSASLTGDLRVEGTGDATSVNAGGLTGYSGQNLTGCTATVKGAVTVSGKGQDIFGGGLAGRVMDTGTTVSNCQAAIGTLSVSGPGAYTYGGGLTGYAGTITGCTATITGNSLTVTGTGNAANAYGGGLTGGTVGGITNCSVEAGNAALTVITEGGTEAYGGGLVGRTWGTVSACGAKVKSLAVTGNGTLVYGGGLAGYANDMDSCTNINISSVTVEGKGTATNAYGGGLAGMPYWGVTGCEIKNGALTVKVTGTGKDIYGGGLAGRTYGTVSDSSTRIGSLTVTGTSLATYTYGGGLGGYANIITGCHAEAESITVTADGPEAGAYGGGLAGEVHSEGWSTGSCTAKTGVLTVERKGGTAGQSEEYNAYAGGLVARASGRIDVCTAETGTLHVTGDGVLVYGSGLAGSAKGTVSKCDATVTTEIIVLGTGADTKTYGAGLAGQPDGGVEYSTALVKSMTVTGTKNTTAAGGLVAYTTSSLTNCAAGVGTLTVTGAGYDTYGAGLAGRANGGVTSCEAGTDSLKVTGPETANTYTYAGGLVGSSEAGSITLSYAMGRISKDSARVNHAGGLVGYSLGTIKDCYAAVDVSGMSAENLGGLVGNSWTRSINNSYWLRGVFRYRGDTYTMSGSGLTDSGNYTTRSDILWNKSLQDLGMRGWVEICKPVNDFPASGSTGYETWMADYSVNGFSWYYPSTVVDRNGKAVHYGLWPIEEGTVRSRNLEDAADLALPDAALPGPAALPAEPGLKPKDESDQTP